MNYAVNNGYYTVGFNEFDDAYKYAREEYLNGATVCIWSYLGVKPVKILDNSFWKN